MEELKDLKERLSMNRKGGAVRLSAEQKAEAFAFADGYKAFLDAAKTEREAVSTAVEMAKAKGFVEFVPGTKYLPGDKVYYNNRGKAVILCVMGSDPLTKGVSIMAAHVDSPRLDLKPNPLYEDGKIALFKTHYYGGIRKYQWPSIPLALHGVVMRTDGSKLTVAIGDKPEDPVFYITDLLPHLGAEQSKRSLSDGIRGEELNVVVGSLPYEGDLEGADSIKMNILKLLNEQYGLVESDFLSAELEVVPADNARDVGFDRSLIAAHGQDDRVCGYTALMAILDIEGIPTKTCVTVLCDKEEIGSEGNTGFQGSFMPYFIDDLAAPYGIKGRVVLSASQCLSADVGAAFDPTFPSVYDPKNSCFINGGVCIVKYTGSRGKGGSNDASAEYMGYIRRLLDSHDVVWQFGELGAVDAGGGGTVACYIANMDVDTVDLGVPVLAMHAPIELTSKIDVYCTYKAFYTFAMRQADFNKL